MAVNIRSKRAVKPSRKPVAARKPKTHVSPKGSRGETILGLHIRATGLPDPEREFRFHPVRRWRFDFAWPDHMIACEVEGGTHSGGRHTRASGFAGDCEKYNAAALLGWRVYRVTTEMVVSGYAISLMEEAHGVSRNNAD